MNLLLAGIIAAKNLAQRNQITFLPILGKRTKQTANVSGSTTLSKRGAVIGNGLLQQIGQILIRTKEFLKTLSVLKKRNS